MKPMKHHRFSFLWVVVFLAITLATSNAWGQTITGYTTTSSWTNSSGYTSVTVQCWGGGTSAMKIIAIVSKLQYSFNMPEDNFFKSKREC